MRPKGRVMLVEDDLDLMDLYRLLLDSAGYTVWGTARSGEEALDQLHDASSDALPDVIVLDHRLPGCTGLDVAKDTLAHYPRMQIIMTTADTSAREPARRAGVRRFNAKPVSNDLLLRCIDDAMRESAGG